MNYLHIGLITREKEYPRQWNEVKKEIVTGIESKKEIVTGIESNKEIVTGIESNKEIVTGIESNKEIVTGIESNSNNALNENKLNKQLMPREKRSFKSTRDTRSPKFLG